MDRNDTLTAFAGTRRIAAGARAEVALALHRHIRGQPLDRVLVFEDATGAQTDLDLSGTEADVAARHAPAPVPSAKAAKAGRPALGVVSREVTLLPRHWEWLAAQPGGASATLRRLVDSARQSGGVDARVRRDAAYRFMSALAGDLPGFEEASRALFAGDAARLSEHMAAWPADVAAHVRTLLGETP
ncbi:MAG TPA: DUF2239 family protein [Azospirillaceae bacterium]|nr:DUF2239 family protein [Azospirillaceae bacterium]